MLGPLLEVEMSKKCTPLWREAHFEVKMYKTHHSRTTFGSWDVEKVHAVVAWSTFEVKMYKAADIRTTFGRSGVILRGGRKGDGAPCQKRAKCDGFVAFTISKKRWQAWDIWTGSVAGAQKTCSSELLGGPGADFLREVVLWSLKSSGLLRWFCATGAALRMTWHHFFVAGAVVLTSGLEKSQNSLVRGRQRCTQLSVFEGSLAELLRFWCCQLWKMKSRRIASFFTLSSWNIEEVLQHCFVFDVVNFEKWRSLAELLRFWCCQVDYELTIFIPFHILNTTRNHGGCRSALRAFRHRLSHGESLVNPGIV